MQIAQDSVRQEKRIIKTIIFIIEATFTHRDYERHGIDLLIGNGFHVEVWDFTPFLNQGYFHEINRKGNSTWSGIRIFRKRKEATEALRALNAKCLLICGFGYRIATYHIFKCISDLRLPFAVCWANALPANVTFREKWKTYISCFRPSVILESLLARTPPELLGLKYADIILAGGTQSLSKRYPRGPRSLVIWGHSWDYDIFLKLRNQTGRIPEKTCVFLDEYLPFHPDLTILGVDSPVHPDQYYVLLRSFFSHLEKQYGIEIIIAAHPLSQYEEHPDLFGGRRVIRGNTGELVRDSAFVIAHSSTSLNYANLFEKPVIFITTAGLDQSLQSPLIYRMAKLFGKIPINLSQPLQLDLEKEMKVDNERYASFRQAHIKTKESKDRPFWQILADSLKGEEGAVL